MLKLRPSSISKAAEELSAALLTASLPAGMKATDAIDLLCLMKLTREPCFVVLAPRLILLL